MYFLVTAQNKFSLKKKYHKIKETKLPQALIYFLILMTRTEKSHFEEF